MAQKELNNTGRQGAPCEARPGGLPQFCRGLCRGRLKTEPEPEPDPVGLTRVMIITGFVGPPGCFETVSLQPADRIYSRNPGIRKFREEALPQGAPSDSLSAVHGSDSLASPTIAHDERP